MREISLPRPSSSEDIFRALERMAQEIPDAEILEKGDSSLLLSLPTYHRFYSGDVRILWEWKRAEKVERVKLDMQNHLSLTRAGKTLLVLGALGVIPWVLWTVIPPLIPLIPMGAVMLFLAWLAVGRPPHMFTEEMMEHKLSSTMKKGSPSAP